jgi:hypothetical protein
VAEEKERTMRHVKAVTHGAPKAADQIQDTLCVVIDLVAGIIGAIGGATPFVEYLDTKCNFGIPDDNTP